MLSFLCSLPRNILKRATHLQSYRTCSKKGLIKADCRLKLVGVVCWNGAWLGIVFIHRQPALIAISLLRMEAVDFGFRKILIAHSYACDLGLAKAQEVRVCKNNQLYNLMAAISVKSSSKVWQMLLLENTGCIGNAY